MKTCPRCDSSIEQEARYCVECGAPQTEAAAEEFDKRVQQQAQKVAAESGNAGGGAGPEHTLTDQLSDREQLWRRTCYVFGYGTIVGAFTLVPQVASFFLILGGIAILPPIRRLTAKPLGSPLKREVMLGLYVVLVLLGVALFVLV
ncbi:zinc ribbon domain-containing protein [Halorubrum sp. E3]|uniref:Zinc ribbon domain-containing protein n=1 Tax=Halorubrum persicum TaxID=1383844 RepID=A0A2G1WGI7_9EURY|nr:zinc ribbon domain-containing protein [Halorubrum persicum]OYR82364.1 zinc ribbon domain-containing protein [Halorubrum sp. E3]PHQ38065.1 zinc ribbon domain-containing protein [Halorubrum persicum]